jgi:hypothetical protein
LLTLALAATHGTSRGAVRLGEGPELVLHVRGETGVDLEGIRGEIRIRSGRASQMRFSCRGLEPGRPRLPVTLWRDGARFRIAPGEGSRDRARRLELTVPPGFRVRVEGRDAWVKASRLEGPIELSGEGLEFIGDSPRGDVTLELTGGRARVVDLDGDLTVDGRELELETRKVTGRVFAILEGGSAVFEQTRGDVDLNVHATALTLETVLGAARVRASTGTVRAQSVLRGGELILEDAPLELAGCGGTLRVETDAPVELSGNRATVKIDGYGAPVTGRGHQGPLTIKTDGAEVLLEQLGGPLRLEGEALTARVDGAAAEVEVKTRSSRITVVDASAPVTIDNEYGDVAVESAEDRVTIRSRDGNVRLVEIAGPVSVDAEGRRVWVVWKSLHAGEDSEIVNRRGDVAVRFPDRGGCAVEASAHFGRIENDLDELRVSDDGDRASGEIRGQARPLVKIEAAGKVVLTREPLEELEELEPSPR